MVTDHFRGPSAKRAWGILIFVPMPAATHKAGILAVATVAALALLAARPAAAQDILGWKGVSWGMSTAEIDAALGRNARRTPGRLDYGLYYTERTIPEVAFGDARFTAMLQMDKGSGRLRQILLELRRPSVSPKSYGEVLRALEKRFGAPAAKCLALEKRETPRIADIVWRIGPTIARAVFLDFQTTAIVSRDPNVDIDPLADLNKLQRNNSRFLPKRVLVRLSDASDPSLTGSCQTAQNKGGVTAPS
jgi:hypothetical protein